MRPDELLGLLRTHGLTPENWHENELILEFIFWGIVLLLTLVLLIFRPRFLQRWEGYWKRFSRRQGLAVLTTILAALTLRLALLPLLPIPVPVVHDEYSYLLQAETFASGRLTNPTPPMWVHFESFHVNMRPSYQSMYPPAQALPMAAALVLNLQPWWGVWLGIALMCGAICWMLQAWMPPHWALLGGMFCVVRFATFSYWVNSYWGGAVAAIGGALILGALPRIKRSPKARYGILFALGLVLVANSRPYEGLVFSIPALIALALWLFGIGRQRSLRVAALAPAFSLLLLAGAGMAYYNWRSTGNPADLPYAENQRQYHITKPFIWQKRNPIPQYRHALMRRMYVFHELPDYLNRQYSEGLVNMEELKAQILYDFYVWPLFGLLAFACWAMFKSRHVWLLPATIATLLAGMMLEEWPPNAHYAAPATCVFIAVLLYGLRLLRTWKPHGLPFGFMAARAVVITFLAWLAVPLTAMALNPYSLGLYQVMPSGLDRARIAAQLQQTDGQHLVLVRTRDSDPGLYDWVYNSADIEHSKIIWARDMGDRGQPGTDRSLLLSAASGWWIRTTAS